jgi:Carboxypeptidase regulatory-like domain
MNRRIKLILTFCLTAIVLSVTMTARADIKGAVSGIVTDPKAAVIPGASVTATNIETRVQSRTVTDGKGFYSLPALPLGTYTISIKTVGFSEYEQTGVVIDANSSIRLDVALQLATVTNMVTVKSNALQIETQSTQMGEVIEAEKIEAVPLNGRSFIDLLALQPGVSPYTITAFNTGTGIGGKTISGALSDGNQSVNGGRSGSNAYLINGGYAEEGAHQAAAMVPNLDSIAEFRIITNNYNAEYGNYSGGQVNIVTKSGANRFHGSAFEFLRNNDFDAKNYYAATVSPYKQNQFGGTLGAPIIRGRVFGFLDYQGTRQTIASVQNYAVASAAEHAGDFSLLGSSLSKVVGGSGTGQTKWAQVLSSRLGYTVTQGEHYYTPGCTTTAQCVFPNAKIPTTGFDPVGKNLTPYVPLPTNTATNFFGTTAYSQTLSDDKGSARVDVNTRLGSLFAYYFRDHFNGVNPFFRHTNVPGFSSSNTGFTQMANVGLTTTINSSVVNDLRLVYLRVSGTLGQPTGGTAPGELAKLGFNTSWNSTGGIGPVVPSYEGVPGVALKKANFGATISTIRQANNTVQVIDNVMKTLGTHLIQFGFNYHYDQINERNTSCPNGCFSFNGSETGIDFADLLIGAPSSFSQAGLTQLNSRSTYFGAYGQDSWRVSPTLTFNYGIRWDISQPWYDTKNMLSTFVPGEQSRVFPNAPTGMVFPGDFGIPKTIAPTRFDDFAPRIGIAYAPASGKFSVRAGYGIFYSAIQQVTGMNTAGGPPFNVYYGSPVQPSLTSPYIDRYSGSFEGLKFPVPLPPSNVSTSNPDTIDFTQFEQISGSFGIYPGNVLPVTQNYELSVQRSIGAATVASVSYVGTTGRHQMTSIEANPGNQALCVYLSNPANVSSSSATCSQSGEDQQYIERDGTVINGTRTAFGTLALGSNPWMKSAAGSSYNSLQASLKHRDKYDDFLLGYTWSKSMDNSSDAFDSSNPYNPSQSRALSYHDVPHHFVASYTVQLPFNKLMGGNGFVDRVATGWAVSGVTSLTSGEVIGLSESYDDNSLSGAYNAAVDAPSYANNGSKLFQSGVSSKNPRTGSPYFNPNFYVTEPYGQIGNAMRRSFHGPGVINTDLALQKYTHITETTQLQFRAEAFNAFNHTQFDGADGEIGDTGVGGFGYTTSARAPRIMQLALKFLF